MAEKESETEIVEVERLVLKTMKTKLQQLEEESQERRTICRVPPLFRNKHSEDYGPQIISIGPLHAGKKTLEPMEHLKWRYLQDLLWRCCPCGQQDMLAKYVKKVSELETQARKRYADAVELDSDAFVQIMVLDACFIIETLIQWKYGVKRRERVQEIKWCWPLMKNDLLLLENQIPFFIVRSLFELSNIPGLLDVEKLAISYVTLGKSNSIPVTVNPKNVHHLLHLFQLSFLPTSTQMNASSCGHMVMNTIKKIGSEASGSLFWLIISTLCCRLSKWHQQITDEERLAPYVIPSATELEESGVEFKGKKVKCLLDVTFRDGVMEIPLLTIEDNTIPEFRNLMAFEQCCPTSGDHFTSYATLLDNLINTREDVVVLKKYGIIENLLGRDEEVANLFNSLCEGTILNYERHYLAELYKDINQYCKVARHRWRARLMHDYFGNPWAIISVVAAIILLIFTVVQAIYAILGYHKPPK